MDLTSNSSDSMISLGHYTLSNIKFKEEAKQLILNLPEKLEEKSDNDTEYKINQDIFKFEVLKKLCDINETLTIDDVIHLTNVKSTNEKIVLKKILNAKEKITPRDIIELVNRQYFYNNLNTHYIRYDLDLEEIEYIKLSTLYIDKQWSIINSSIRRDNNDYICKVRQFREVKKSYSQFIEYIENRLKNIKDDVNIEIANTKVPKNKLEECTHVYEGVENEVLRLLKRIMIPEGCYMILTWLSPPEWKKKFNIDKLNYDFVRSDCDFTKENNDDYMSYAYQKPLDEFAKEVRLEPVLEMYWESEEQFTKRLVMLDKKTRDNMSILDMINNSHKVLNNKQQYIDGRRKYKNKLKQNIVSNIDGINQILSANNQTSLKNIKSIFFNDTLFNIKLMSLDIYAELNQPYGDLTRPSKVIISLFNQLYKTLNDSDEFPKPLWKKTEQILHLIEKSKAKKNKNIKLKCEAVKLIQREANKLYDSPLSNVRVQKLLPNRLMIPKQKPPKKPKKPTLNNEQLMYLKCFTNLSPTDITSNITAVPKFKME